MKINNKELFNISRLEEYAQKFEAKAVEIENKIVTLEAEIEKLNEQIDKAQIADIMEGTTATRKELNNLKARKDNIIAQYNQEVENNEKLRQLMAVGLQDIIPEVSHQIAEDKAVYFDVIEKEIYKQLAEVREKQAELLLTLALARKTAYSDISEFDLYCETFGFKPVGINFVHTNPMKIHRNLPQYGSPLLDLTEISNIENVLMRSRADANSAYNKDREDKGLEKKQLPLEKTFVDIDLQKFLDSLK